MAKVVGESRRLFVLESSQSLRFMVLSHLISSS